MKSQINEEQLMFLPLWFFFLNSIFQPNSIQGRTVQELATLIIPTSECYYSELNNVIMYYLNIQFLLTKVHQ